MLLSATIRWALDGKTSLTRSLTELEKERHERGSPLKGVISISHSMVDNQLNRPLPEWSAGRGVGFGKVAPIGLLNGVELSNGRGGGSEKLVSVGRL
jgi:hypothetical protein